MTTRRCRRQLRPPGDTKPEGPGNGRNLGDFAAAIVVAMRGVFAAAIERAALAFVDHIVSGVLGVVSSAGMHSRYHERGNQKHCEPK